MRGIALVLVAAAAGGARADEPASGAEPKLIPAKTAPKAADHLGMSHQGQIEASVRLALGLRAIATYNDEFCGAVDDNGQAAVCTGRAPFSLDFELGYGAARKIDVFVELRIGLESDFGATPTDTGGTHIFHVSPGGRFFFGDAGATKLFTTAQAVFDFSGYKDAAGSGLGADFGLRNLNGLWFDLDRAYGFYLFVGETATFARWLRFELEGGFGIQGRYR